MTEREQQQIHGRLDAMTGRLDAITERLNRIAEASTTRLDGITKRMDDMKLDNDGIRKVFRIFSEEFEALQRQVRGLNTREGRLDP